MIVVADAGPLIHLSLVRQLDLEPALFGRILVPEKFTLRKRDFPRAVVTADPEIRERVKVVVEPREEDVNRGDFLEGWRKIDVWGG